MSELQKSKSWETRNQVKLPPSEGFEGYPFDEGWPRCGPRDNKRFELIMRDGKRHFARVDFDAKFRAVGPAWRTLFGGFLNRDLVVAWREVD